jgi:hypothetical protein
MITGGGVLLPKEVGGVDGTTICEKPSKLAAVAIAAAKCQQVVAHCQLSFSRCWHLQHCLDVSESLVFEVKKLLKGINNLRTQCPRLKKKLVVRGKDMSPPPLREFSDGKQVTANSHQAERLYQHWFIQYFFLLNNSILHTRIYRGYVHVY